MNNVTMIGRIANEIEIKTTQSMKQYTNITIAVKRQKQSDTTDFIDCKAWNATALFIQKYFEKGAMIAVKGEITTNNYTDKNGQKQYKTYITIHNVYFCGHKKNNATENDKVFGPGELDEDHPLFC